jgi:hypothetical protein
MSNEQNQRGRPTCEPHANGVQPNNMRDLTVAQVRILSRLVKKEFA